MKVNTTALQNNQRASKVIERAISMPERAENSQSMQENASMQKELKRILAKHALTLEDIIKKYKDIYDGSIAGTKVSDIVKVLENLTKLHNIGNETITDELTITLASKSTQELAEYTESTLKSTQEILARIQARRVNSKP